uniref:Putative ovule protein n=1 Tax=Solanum chacoense TaxID=4108 RepID=A0A0V0GJP2_SOLCH
MSSSHFVVCFEMVFIKHFQFENLSRLRDSETEFFIPNRIKAAIYDLGFCSLITQFENDIRITTLKVPNDQTPALYNHHFYLSKFVSHID